MNKKLFIFICCMCISLTTYSQNYYWYKNRQIFLQEGNMSYVVFEAQDSLTIASAPFVHTEYVNSTEKQTNQMWGIISSEDLRRSPRILYETKSLLVNDTRNVYVTQRFYVKLKKEEDLSVLKECVAKYDATIETKGALSLWYVLKCNDHSQHNALELANIFFESGQFAASEPEFINIVQNTCVNDTYFDHQWNLKNTGQYGSAYSGVDINFCEAHSITNGSPSVIIGVFDTGVQLTHPDINIYPKSYDIHLQTPQTTIYEEHGTACAGIICGKGNNNLGIAGIAPSCPALSICYSTYASADNFARGFRFARDSNVSVINCSWHMFVQSEYTENAIDSALTYGRNGRGCVIVFSAGNGGYELIDYPANSNPDILVVGAVAPDGRRKTTNSEFGENHWGSCYGSQLDIMAPGINIPTTDITGTSGYSSSLDTLDYFMRFGCTSAACPHVAAVAGLILSINPFFSQKEVADIIESTAQKTGNYSYEPNHPNGSWNNNMGYGLVDAYAAVLEAQNRFPIQGPDYVCDTAKYYLLQPLQTGESVTWSVDNGSWTYPHYSIIGSANQDTVYVRCERMTIVPPGPHPDYMNSGNTSFNDPIQSLSVTISNGTTSNSCTKQFRSPTGDRPIVSASNSAYTWRSGTTRTFTISNCTSVPDSLLQWKVQNVMIPRVGPNDTIINYSTGRTLSYTAYAPAQAICYLDITAINTMKDCLPNDTTLSFKVRGGVLLNAFDDGDQLQITILEQEDSEALQPIQSFLDLYGDCTLELWNSVYGCMRSQSARSSYEQMDIAGFPQGVYILRLKDAEDTIAETKVIIQ